MPRKKPLAIPWEDVPQELEFAKVLISVMRSIESICDTDAARGRALWALAVYFFTKRDDLVPVSGQSKAAFDGLKINMDMSRRGILNGSKGGRPRTSKGKRNARNSVPAKYEQGTRQSTPAQDGKNTPSPANTRLVDDDLGSTYGTNQQNRTEVKGRDALRASRITPLYKAKNSTMTPRELDQLDPAIRYGGIS
ncbi:MAG: hypothetical protein Q4C09_03065 [Atopobiaceae bacterium]|nr:hypothetical protein [Atopobiaceae bacterium]